jgi:hypothetical protein
VNPSKFHAHVVLLLVAVPIVFACTAQAVPDSEQDGARSGDETNNAAAGEPRTLQVSGSAVHFFSTAVVHSQQPTDSGMIQRSSEVIRLNGDLDGFILYHPTSSFDHPASRLVTTGIQVFSGTISGSEPLLLYDDQFRFDVDLATGETRGSVFFESSSLLAGDRTVASDVGYACTLEVIGTGMTAEGDALADYTGVCTVAAVAVSAGAAGRVE